MPKRIIFFTAGPTATTNEQLAISKLNTQAAAPYQVTVYSSKSSPNYGAGPAPADYVAGTIPTAYNQLPVFNPDAPPAPTLPTTQAVVTNGQKITGVTGSGTVANIVVDPTTKAVTINLTAS